MVGNMTKLCKCGCRKEVTKIYSQYADNHGLKFRGNGTNGPKYKGTYKVFRPCKCGCGLHVYNHDRTFCDGHNIGISPKKGKTWEEIYGKEKAKQWKQDMGAIMAQPLDERVGIEKAQEIRQKQSIAHTGKKKPTSGFASINLKGKTLEELWGKETADRMINTVSNYAKKRGTKNLQTKSAIEKRVKTRRENGTYAWTEEQRKKTSLSKTIPKEKIIKEFLDKFNLVGGFMKSEWNSFMEGCSDDTVVNKFGSLDAFAEYVGIEFNKPDTLVFGHPGSIMGKNEQIAFEEYRRQNPNNEIISQLSIKSPNGGTYHIDWYDQTKNIAFEFDEGHHVCQQVHDYRRQKHIENILGCQFVRIKENDWLKSKNQIPLKEFFEVS
jgi:very-short-patch-repair endonuclease